MVDITFDFLVHLRPEVFQADGFERASDTHVSSVLASVKFVNNFSPFACREAHQKALVNRALISLVENAVVYDELRSCSLLLFSGTGFSR